MSAAARSLFVFSIYLFVLGLLLVVAPNFLLGLFFVPATHEVWVRVVGLLAVLLGFYYFKAAGAEFRMFFGWTVVTRIAMFVVFLLFAITGMGPPALVLFGLVDLVGAVWTMVALREDPEMKIPGMLD